MVNKYNNPRLFNTVLTGPGMNHPRNPHVVIGSDTKGFVQGDMMDANAVMETIDQKIDVDNLIDDNKLTTAVNNAVTSILGGVVENLDTLEKVSKSLLGEKVPNSWNKQNVNRFIGSILGDTNAIPGKKYYIATEELNSNLASEIFGNDINYIPDSNMVSWVLYINILSDGVKRDQYTRTKDI